MLVIQRGQMASDNNVFTLRRGYAPPRSPEAFRRSGIKRHIHSPHCSRPAEIVLDVRLVQFRVNGRREHGNVR